MAESTLVLMGTAFSLAFMHTAIGPDHYLPFIILGKSEGWSLKRILMWTLLCGIAHVVSSIVVGAIGIGVGISMGKIEQFEGVRSSVSAWALIILGFTYMVYGIIKGRFFQHQHLHTHLNDDERRGNRAFWGLFLVFILGPCEPLILLLMFPAANLGMMSVLAAVLAFAVTTLATMLVMVTLSYVGIRLFEFKFLHRYVHAFSGLAIGLSGVMFL